ncbi:MAG TPA: hypothetical protein VE262_22805 [Blastocatellia bacterium]|nr:hypothetical protein [Blastocatellia bacterium]
MNNEEGKRTGMAALVLLLVGLMQMAGDLLNVPALKGVGAATVASPAPKVFSSVAGLETYSTRFFIEWTGTDGAEHSLELTPEVYARIEGPYNRRNVYGAAMAYGPVLSTDPRAQSMFNSVSGHAMCGEAPLLRELGINPATVEGRVRVRYEPLPGTNMGDLPRLLEAPCR